MLRDGMKTCAKDGVPPENDWPYKIQNFTTKPPQASYDHALRHQVMKYYRIPTGLLIYMKNCLAQGFPFVFGMAVFQSFETQEVLKTGIMPMPGPTEVMVGGHAVLAVGYNDVSKRLTVRNSWGPEWGMRGYFTMPYEYVQSADFVDDFWTIRLVET
jgi:C1A family cysteine protease